MKPSPERATFSPTATFSGASTTGRWAGGATTTAGGGRRRSLVEGEPRASVVGTVERTAPVVVPSADLVVVEDAFDGLVVLVWRPGATAGLADVLAVVLLAPVWLVGPCVVVVARLVVVPAWAASLEGRGRASGGEVGAVVVVAAGAPAAGADVLAVLPPCTEAAVELDELSGKSPPVVGPGCSCDVGPVEAASVVLGAMVVDVAVVELADWLVAGRAPVVLVLDVEPVEDALAELLAGSDVVEDGSDVVEDGSDVVEDGVSVVVVAPAVVVLPGWPEELVVEAATVVGGVLETVLDDSAGVVVVAPAVVVGLVALVVVVVVVEPVSAQAGWLASVSDSQGRATQTAHSNRTKRRGLRLTQRATTLRPTVRDGKLTRYTPVGRRKRDLPARPGYPTPMPSRAGEQVLLSYVAALR